MFQLLRSFAAEENGQDLIEYSLIITFIAIACMAFVGTGRPGIERVWTVSNSKLVSAKSAATGS
jgi:Flp pilus assembly pilin Flp